MRISGNRHRAYAIALIAASLVGPTAVLAPARAQAQRSDEPADLSQPNLSGNWGGLRTYLEGKGLTFTLNYTNDFLANVRGGIGPGAVGIGVFQPQLDINLQKFVGLEGGKIHTHGLITHGPFFSPTYLGNILEISNLEAGAVARLCDSGELWRPDFRRLPPDRRLYWARSQGRGGAPPTMGWPCSCGGSKRGFLCQSQVVPDGVIASANRTARPCDAIGPRLPV
jgi:hypothetical protein